MDFCFCFFSHIIFTTLETGAYQLIISVYEQIFPPNIWPFQRFLSQRSLNIMTKTHQIPFITFNFIITPISFVFLYFLSQILYHGLCFMCVMIKGQTGLKTQQSIFVYTVRITSLTHIVIILQVLPSIFTTKSISSNLFFHDFFTCIISITLKSVHHIYQQTVSQNNN